MNKSKHIDQGVGSVLFDAMGKPIESSDAKNARSLSTFDGFNRPVNGWSQNNSSDSLRLTAHAIYGETATNPKDKNLLGQLWQQYDESGKVESIEFDFKQNLLSKKQKVISSTELKSSLDNYQTYLVDWTGLPNILGTQEFETSSDFDALNRPIKITLPENVNTERKEIIPSYNRAGGLEKVHYDNTEYVNNIVYNAKGQRLLIAFGNDVMTRYVYSNSTFRLQRQKSEKFTYSHAGSNHTYTPQAGTKRQDDGFNFDLLGNIMKILHRTTDCGISGTSAGSDALNRDFDYDPLYRVTSANGRESDTQNQNDYLYADAPNPGTPNSNNVRAYTRKYSFDKLGNVQQVKQLGTNGFTRNFVYHTGKNTLQKIETAAPALLEDFTYDVCGNQLTAGTTRNYVWNAANQLITYKNQVGSNDPTIFAQYDYSGMNRVSKMVKTGSAGSPVYERTIYIDGVFEYHILENGTTYEKNYIHVMDDASRIAMVRIGAPFPDDIADSVTYNLEDQIGSSSMRLNTSGSIIDKEEYYPFGVSSLRTFSKKRYRYVGKEKDLESGLYYYGARYYAAWTCRFISIDPLAADYAHLTPYNNTGNKVINSVDIDGMQGSNENQSGGSDGNGETPSEHIIQKGDTFWDLENKYNIEHGTLKKLNPEADPYNLQIGDKTTLRESDNLQPEQQGRIIFVNGYLGFGSPEGGEAYWNKSFEEGAKEFFDVTGESYFTDIDYQMETTAFDRQVAGFTYARNNIDKITAGLDKNTDGIYFVSHSMGAAFAFGMEIYLISQGWHVRSSVFLNAYQALSMNVSHKYDNYVIHVDYQNTNDPVLNRFDYKAPITGNIDLRIRYQAPKPWEFVHRYPISRGSLFWDDLKQGKNGDYQYFKSFLNTKTW